MTVAFSSDNVAKSAPLGGIFWDGAKTFIHKGTNGRWRDVLTVAESARYERIALEKLGPDCARWLAEGSAPQSMHAAA